MNSEYLSHLQNEGIAVHIALDRFMNNESFYEKYIRMFPEDKTFPLLQEAYQRNDWDNAKIYTHSLKGLSASLGFLSLSSIAEKLLSCLKKEDVSHYEIYYKQLVNNYHQVLNLLHEVDKKFS